MKRHQSALLLVFAVIFSYNALLILIPETATYPRWILSVLPWHALISLGCYCLFRLGSDLLRFNDCPQEIVKMTEVSSPLVSFTLLFISSLGYLQGEGGSQEERLQRRIGGQQSPHSSDLFLPRYLFSS